MTYKRLFPYFQYVILIIFAVLIYNFLTMPSFYRKCNKIEYNNSIYNESFTYFLEKTLENNLFGQEEAVKLILTAFRTREDGKPLSFHFVGENGVGKTLASSLIGKTMFENEEDGVLYIRGNSYQSFSMDKTEENRNELRSKVLKFITKCPDGLIIIDEVERLHKETVAIFQDFLDYTFTSKNEVNQFSSKVSSGNSIFIFISDFGAEGFTKNMTMKELLTAVRIESEKQWQNYKQIALIQHIIPFMPMQREGVYKKVIDLMDHLKDHIRFKQWSINIDKIEYCTENEIIKIAEHIYQETYKHLSPENYRGVEKVFKMDVTNNVLLKVQKFISENGSIVGSKQSDEKKLKIFLCFKKEEENPVEVKVFKM